MQETMCQISVPQQFQKLNCDKIEEESLNEINTSRQID